VDGAPGEPMAGVEGPVSYPLNSVGEEGAADAAPNTLVVASSGLRGVVRFPLGGRSVVGIAVLEANVWWIPHRVV
jgi:hypothetical protein